MLLEIKVPVLLILCLLDHWIYSALQKHIYDPMTRQFASLNNTIRIQIVSQTCAHGRGGGVGFFVNHNIQFKIVDSPFFESFENIAITIGSPGFIIACVYRPPGSCSDAFCDEFFSIFEYLSSVSQNFLICGYFNIHLDTTSKDSEKFLYCLESCNINQHVHKPTRLHGHTVLFQMFGSVILFQIMPWCWVNLILPTLLYLCQKLLPFGGFTG